MSLKPPISKTSQTKTLPRAAASFILLRRTTVLLVRRGTQPRHGLWSLPGGHIEPGETAAEAASRELYEETGMQAINQGLVDIHDVIIQDPGGFITAQYLLAVFWGLWTSGEPTASSDAADARFVALNQLEDFQLTPGANRLIALAVQKHTSARTLTDTN
jgi:8-oxo-dGTP diphosphatase